MAISFAHVSPCMARGCRIGAVPCGFCDGGNQLQNYEIFLKLYAFCIIILNRCIIFAPYSLEKSATIFLYILYILVRET